MKKPGGLPIIAILPLSLWEHETEDLRLGLMLSCGSTQTRYFELTIRQKGANDNDEE